MDDFSLGPPDLDKHDPGLVTNTRIKRKLERIAADRQVSLWCRIHAPNEPDERFRTGRLIIDGATLVYRSRVPRRRIDLSDARFGQ